MAHFIETFWIRKVFYIDTPTLVSFILCIKTRGPSTSKKHLGVCLTNNLLRVIACSSLVEGDEGYYLPNSPNLVIIIHAHCLHCLGIS